MESSSVPLHYQDGNMYQNCPTLYQCGYLSSEGYSSLSPASSTDSCGLSPPYMHYSTTQYAYENTSLAFSQTMSSKAQTKISTEKKNKKKSKLPYSQRQSASEREKMRMRNLSKALQNLRRYLPPSVAPADKSLTKIETLQLTIRYISHLSTLLGLSEDVLEQRRLEATQRNNRCPNDYSCYIDMTQQLCSQPREEGVMPFPAFAQSTVLQNTQHSYNSSLEVPNLSEVQSTHHQYQYPAIRAALPQLSRDYYSTNLQQMVTCEEYTNGMEL
ncbi:uncharacterized protein PAF06_009788 [Gastrophryne carolinensis]